MTAVIVIAAVAVLVAVLLFVVLLPWFSVPWLVLGAVPWLAGIAALAPQRRGCEAAAVL